MNERVRRTIMMQTLETAFYRPNKNAPDTRIKIPLSSLNTSENISEKPLPSKAKASLEREGIDLNHLSELFAKQGPKGTLIEIENTEERIVI
jgi:hypothetical protein